MAGNQPTTRATATPQGVAITPLGNIAIPADPTANGVGPYTPLVTLVQSAILQKLPDVLSVWVDASNAVDPVVIRNANTRQYCTWPPGTFGWQNLLLKADAVQMELYCFSAVTIAACVCSDILPSFLAQSGVVRSSPYTTITRKAALAASQTLLAANSERQGFSFFNDSAARCYLLLNNSVASATNFTVPVEPSWYYESPFQYGGEVRGIWTSATGAGQLTEFF